MGSRTYTDILRIIKLFSETYRKVTITELMLMASEWEDKFLRVQGTGRKGQATKIIWKEGGGKPARAKEKDAGGKQGRKAARLERAEEQEVGRRPGLDEGENEKGWALELRRD